jgi:hypothetical protein
VTTTPVLNQSNYSLTILESGTNVTGLTLFGTGFEAAPYQDYNLLNIYDLENALYSNGGTSADASPTYSHEITTSTRTTLVIMFPTLHRNSSKINPQLSPLSTEVSVDGGSSYFPESFQDEGTDASGRGYSFRAKLYRACLHESDHSCMNGTCYDVVEAPITGLEYVCECQNYTFGGDHCEYSLTENEQKCSRLCLENMQPCRDAYFLASMGFNDEETEGFTVSFKTYVEKYLSLDSGTYVRTSESNVNSAWSCWQLSNHTDPSSALFSSLDRSIIEEGTNPLLSIFSHGDMNFVTSLLVFFFISILALCLFHSPMLFWELI